MIYITMMIFVKEGKETAFHEFEYAVLPILENYEGKLIYRIRPNTDSIVHNEKEVPYEIHFLSFPNEEALLAFGNDEKRKKFIHLKEDSIRFTLMIKGEKV